MTRRISGIEAKVAVEYRRQQELVRSIHFRGIRRAADLAGNPEAGAMARQIKAAWDERWKLSAIARRLILEREKVAKRIERLDFWTKIAADDSRRATDESQLLEETQQAIAEVEDAILAMDEPDALRALLEVDETLELALVESQLDLLPVFAPQLHWGDHDRDIINLEFTPDGKRLLSTDGTEIRVWESGMRTVKRSLKRNHVNAALSPDGEALAVLFPYFVELHKVDGAPGFRVLGTREIRNPAVKDGPSFLGLFSSDEVKPYWGWPIFFSSDGTQLFATQGRPLWSTTFKDRVQAFDAPQMTVRQWREADLTEASRIRALRPYGGDKALFARWCDRGNRIVMVSGDQAQVCRANDLSALYTLKQSCIYASADAGLDRLALFDYSPTAFSVVDLHSGQPVMTEGSPPEGGCFLTENGKHLLTWRHIYSVERQAIIAQFNPGARVWVTTADGKRLVGGCGNQIQEWDLARLLAEAEADFDRRQALKQKLLELATP